MVVSFGSLRKVLSGSVVMAFSDEGDVSWVTLCICWALAALTLPQFSQR